MWTVRALLLIAVGAICGATPAAAPAEPAFRLVARSLASSDPVPVELASRIDSEEASEEVTLTLPTPNSITSVPEPTSLSLLGLGLTIIGLGLRRRKRLQDRARR
jgi:hypothetical protein